MAFGLMLTKEQGLADRAPLHVLLSRNRFGHAGSKVIQQAVSDTGKRHDFRMEGVRPGFGLSPDAAAPVLDVDTTYELMEVLDFSSFSRPSTNNSRKSRGPKRPISPFLSRQPTNHSSRRSAAYSPRRQVLPRSIECNFPPANRLIGDLCACSAYLLAMMSV